MSEQHTGAARVRGTLLKSVAAAAALLSVAALTAGTSGAAAPITLAIFDFELEDRRVLVRRPPARRMWRN